MAVLRKEWIQIRRDPFTLRMIIALPVMQLFLFGYAINTDPKHLPTGLLSADHSKYERTIVAALQNTGYYDIRPLPSEARPNGPRRWRAAVRREHSARISTGRSIVANSRGVDGCRRDRSRRRSATPQPRSASLTAALDRDLPHDIQCQRLPNRRSNSSVHARYNPEQLTVLNIVPGLICIVLTFSTLFVTTLSITRETERGTMENLLAMPVRPIEVMLAKVVPYIVIGYIQVVLIMAIAVAVFGLPIRGSIPLLALALGLFIASNLALGVTILDDRAESDAGGTDGAVHAAAVLPAVRLHVPVQGHAGLGAMGRRGVSRHPCAAHRARRAAEGQRSGRDRAGSVADRRVYVGGRGDCDLVLSGNARLGERRYWRDLHRSDTPANTSMGAICRTDCRTVTQNGASS